MPHIPCIGEQKSLSLGSSWSVTKKKRNKDSKTNNTEAQLSDSWFKEEVEQGEDVDGNLCDPGIWMQTLQSLSWCENKEDDRFNSHICKHVNQLPSELKLVRLEKNLTLFTGALWLWPSTYWLFTRRGRSGVSVPPASLRIILRELMSEMGKTMRLSCWATLGCHNRLPVVNAAGTQLCNQMVFLRCCNLTTDHVKRETRLSRWKTKWQKKNLWTRERKDNEKYVYLTLLITLPK